MRHTSHVPALEFLCAPQVCEMNCIVQFLVSHDPSFFDEYKVEKNGIYFKYKS